MNQKIEPVLEEPIVNLVQDMAVTDQEENNKKIIEFIKRQTELNSEIISVLSTEDLSKEEQRKMVQMLSEGNAKSVQFTKLLKENNDNISLEINETIPPKSNIQDKFNKFKNMVVTARANIDPSIVFRNPKKPDWYEVGYKTAIYYKVLSSTTKSIQKTLGSFLTQAGSNLNVAVKKAKDTSEFFQSQFTLIGEKKHVKTLEKKFSKVFSLLGLEAKEVLHSSELKENVSEEVLMKNIFSKLKNDLSVIKESTDTSFQFPLLNKLSPQLQFDMAQTLLWPKLNLAIKESMSINQNLKESKDDNKYLKIVSDFAKENKFNPDLVIHSLKNNQELLTGYAKSDTLLANKDKIIENADKYGKFILNNFKYLETLVKVADDLTKMINKIGIHPDIKASFNKNLDETVIFSDENNKITFGQLKANVISVHSEEKEYTPKLNKNNA